MCREMAVGKNFFFSKILRGTRNRKTEDGGPVDNDNKNRKGTERWMLGVRNKECKMNNSA